VRSWTAYWFWILDSVIINAFILWKGEVEKEVIGRVGEHLQSQRYFKEALIEYLLKQTLEPKLHYEIVIRKHHKFIAPNPQRLPLKFHQLTSGMPKKKCYYYRWKTSQGQLAKEEQHNTRKGCLVCEVPLCTACFSVYHKL
jgi:hypothetical protein